MWRRKLKEELKANDVLKLHTISFQKSPVCRYGIPYRFNRDNPKESNLFCVHGHIHGGNNSEVGETTLAIVKDILTMMKFY